MDVQLLDEIDPAKRASTVKAFTKDRDPLLSVVMDEADLEVDQVFGYLHRFGSFCVGGSPVALAAIPAENRTATALTQQELLDVAARMVIGPDAEAKDLVRAIFEDMADVTERALETVRPSSQQLQSSWTPFPASGRP